MCVCCKYIYIYTPNGGCMHACMSGVEFKVQGLEFRV